MYFLIALITISIIYFVVRGAAEDGTRRALMEYEQFKKIKDDRDKND